MKVQVAPRAQQRLRTIQAWWRDHRAGVPTQFIDEYEALLERLASMTSSGPLGVRHRVHRGKQIWRVRLKASTQNVYYSIDEISETITIRMIWGARRRRAPRM